MVYYDKNILNVNLYTLKKNGLDLKNYIVKYIMYICGIANIYNEFNYICLCKKRHDYNMINKIYLSLINTEVLFLVKLTEMHSTIKQLFDIFFELFSKKISYDFLNTCFESLLFNKPRKMKMYVYINMYFASENLHISANVMDGIIDYYFLNNKLSTNLMNYINYQYNPSIYIMESTSCYSDEKYYFKRLY